MKKIIFPNVSLFPEGFFFREQTSLDVIHIKKKGSMAKVFKTAQQTGDVDNG